MGMHRYYPALIAFAVLGLIPTSLTARAYNTATMREPAFDACAAPTASEMNAWWVSSNYYAVGVYIGGVNATCKYWAGTNANLGATWVGQIVQQQGWNIAPLYVGYQAPCAADSLGFSKMSWDQQTAYWQGQADADDAAYRLRDLGMWAGSGLETTMVYNDMEGFPYSYGDPCWRSVQGYLNGWTSRWLNQYGQWAGIYGSSGSTMSLLVAEVNDSTFIEPHGIWPAGGGAFYGSYAGSVSVFHNAYIPDNLWAGNQRLYQYTSGHSETWGGVSLSIDSDCFSGDTIGLHQWGIATATCQ